MLKIRKPLKHELLHSPSVLQTLHQKSLFSGLTLQVAAMQPEKVIESKMEGASTKWKLDLNYSNCKKSICELCDLIVSKIYILLLVLC